MFLRRIRLLRIDDLPSLAENISKCLNQSKQLTPLLCACAMGRIDIAKDILTLSAKYMVGLTDETILGRTRLQQTC
jgi:hypothetical protein